MGSPSAAWAFECTSSRSTVLFRAGTSAVVLSAPHGGTLTPDAVPDRPSGCFELDTHTAQLALAVWSALAGAGNAEAAGGAGDGAGGVPALVVGKLHRRKVDLGRARASAADSDAGRAAWDEYHNALREALRAAVAAHGHAHLFDLHGQCHRPHATEVGHMLTNAELRGGSGGGGGGCGGGGSSGSAGCCAGSGASMELGRSSLGAMAQLRAFAGVEDAVRGAHAVGTLLEQQEGGGGVGRCCYRAVPSASTPHPCCCDRCGASDACTRDGCACTGFDAKAWDGASAAGGAMGRCSFFWGANTIAAYGGGRELPGQPPRRSSQLPEFQGRVAATQLETQWTGAREDDAQIERFGAALASAIEGFMRHFYGRGVHSDGDGAPASE